MQMKFLIATAISVLALVPTTATGQEFSGTFELAYTDAVLRRAGAMPMRQVLQKGLVIKTSGFDEPQKVQFVGLLVKDGKVIRSVVGDPFELIPSEVPIFATDEVLMNILNRVEIAHDERLPSNRYTTFDRTVSVEQILPNTKDAKPLVQHCCTGEHMRGGEVLVLYLTPANRDLKADVQTRPGLVGMGHGGGGGKVN